MDSESTRPTTSPPGLLRRIARLLSPSREHTVTSAALLLMLAMLASRMMGYVREAYIAWAFGAGPTTDAYVAAFTLPDFLFYLVAGGSISITFVAMFSRYLAEDKEDVAERVMSIVVTTLVAFFGVLVLLGIWLAPRFVPWWFPGFNHQQVQLCVELTRILLPAQIFFLVGGVVSAVLQTHRRFLLPAMAPLIYTAAIIAGGVTLSGRIGIASLAWGAVVGSFAGPFLLNGAGALRTGMRYRPSFDITHPGFREWLWKSIPLMLGVSLVVADDWILRYFASEAAGDITRLNYAKRLLQVPIGVLGQAVGVASLPFFARLFSERKMAEFAVTVNRSISRLAALCLLATSWMVAAALPIVEIAFQRGHFHHVDAQQTAIYFGWFSLALVFWAVQGLYARAFYAAHDMWRPMTAGTVVTLISLPIYWFMFHHHGVVGLAVASNIGIFMHTVTLAVMLHQQELARLGGLNWRELGKGAAVAVLAGVIAWAAGHGFPHTGGFWGALVFLVLISVTWAAAAAAGLFFTRSELLLLLKRR